MEALTKEQLIEKYGTGIKVGTDGLVRFIDCMGSDSAIVQAARTSYGKGTKTVSEDRGLIRYLMRHRHSTPFEMAEIKLHVRVPMDIWRQWIRHRTASVNEYSTRYSEAIDSQNTTLLEEWRWQSQSNKQGSAGTVEDYDLAAQMTEHESIALNYIKSAYQSFIDSGIAREQARKILPLSTYTEAYWKIDLHNLFHFLSLRMHPHAQLEIREFAEVIAEIVKDWVPNAYEAFDDYRLGGCFFSAQEMAALRALVRSSSVFSVDGTKGLESFLHGSQPARQEFLESHGLTSKRERIEFFQKIKRN